jgi:hypothetical protein
MVALSCCVCVWACEPSICTDASPMPASSLPPDPDVSIAVSCGQWSGEVRWMIMMKKMRTG